MKKYFKWSNVRLLLIFGLMLFLFSFTSHRNKHRNLSEIKVSFKGESKLFLTHEAVNKLLIEKSKDASMIRIVDLDLNTLEQSVNSHEMVERSEVYLSINGVLKADVKQKTPIARFVQFGESYYVDSEGLKMPLSSSFSARVPLVSGTINEINQAALTAILQYIHADEYLKKNITGVQVLSSGNLFLTSRGFEGTIEFGKMIDFDRKFKNLKAFFNKAFADSTIQQYKNINLKFTQQVVCTK